MKDKIIELRYEGRKGMTVRDLLKDIQSELDACETQEEKDAMLDNEVFIDTQDMMGSIINSSLADIIGEVVEGRYLLISNINDVIHHDESYCRKCGKRKRIERFKGICKECKEG